jgi:hypothetical protein
VSLPAFPHSVLRASFDGGHRTVAQRAVAQSDKPQRDLLTDAPRIDMALAAEGERLVARIIAQHRRSRT